MGYYSESNCLCDVGKGKGLNMDQAIKIIDMLMNLAIDLAPDQEFAEMYGFNDKLNEAQAFIDQQRKAK